MDFWRHLDEHVTSYGKIGKCSECLYAGDSTALIKGKRFCEECKSEEHPNKLAEFQDSDATYKCRAESCGADKLSYQEVLVGSCCEVALTQKHYKGDLKDEHQLINKIHQQIRNQITSEGHKLEKAYDDLSAAEEKVREARESLKKAKENEKIANQKLDSLESKLDALREFLLKSEKRVLIVTKAAFKEHDEPPEKKAKKSEDNEKPQCKVCFFPFDNDHPEAVIIPCGHKACFNCISDLPQKKCPSCRAEFTDNNVYKVFN